MDIRNEIVRIFEENGVDFSDSQQLSDVDSILYVSIIVEIEQLLCITLPDFVLSQNEFKDFDEFVNIVIDTYDNVNSKCINSLNDAMLLNEDISDT